MARFTECQECQCWSGKGDANNESGTCWRHPPTADKHGWVSHYPTTQAESGCFAGIPFPKAKKRKDSEHA